LVRREKARIGSLSTKGMKPSRASWGSAQEGARSGDVAGDLISETVGGGKPALVTEALDELDLDVAAVQVHIGIDEMGLGVERRTRVLDGGTESEIEDGRGCSGAEAGPDGVDTGGRQDKARDIEVGGGESELASELAAAQDGAAECIGAPEELGGPGPVGTADHRADPGAADGVAVGVDGGDSVGGETEAGTELLEEGEVSGSLAAEREGPADGDAGDSGAALDDGLDELLACLTAEGEVEGDDKGVVGAEAGEEADALGERIDEGRGVAGVEDGLRVAVESDDDRAAGAGSGLGDAVADNLLVAQVHAVEEPDREAGRAGGWRELGEAVRNPHGVG